MIYSPFLTRENKVILVNRGWHDLIEDRNELPALRKIKDTVINGILTKVPSHGIILHTENLKILMILRFVYKNRCW